MNNCSILILAGGQGKRLEPFTSFNNPKFILKNKSGLTMLEMTINRIKDLNYDIYISTNSQFLDLVQNIVIKYIELKIEIIVEPLFLNTGPSILFSTILLINFKKLIILQSDHYYYDEKLYLDSISNIINNEDNKFFIFIKKCVDDFNKFGVVKCKNNGNSNFLEILNFVEKPSSLPNDDLNLSFFINIGTFIFNPQSFIKLSNYDNLINDSVLFFQKIYINNVPVYFINEKYYSRYKSNSFDQQFLEKKIPLFGYLYKGEWSDLGSVETYLNWYNL
jgi:mannose-1-phosphate guanylyltransferase